MPKDFDPDNVQDLCRIALELHQLFKNLERYDEGNCSKNEVIEVLEATAVASMKFAERIRKSRKPSEYQTLKEKKSAGGAVILKFRKRSP